MLQYFVVVSVHSDYRGIGLQGHSEGQLDSQFRGTSLPSVDFLSSDDFEANFSGESG